MISKIILGTAQIGLNYGINNTTGKLTLPESLKLLDTAFEMGIRSLDTAEAYGNATEIIGIFHQQNSLKKFDIINKLDSNKKYAINDLENHIIQSCKILNCDKIHSYMFHSFEHLKQSKSVLNRLIDIKKNGLIDNIGVSVYNNYEIMHIVNNKIKVDFIQVPFNLLDNDFQRAQAIKKAKERGISVHVRSVLLQGLFMKSLSKNDKLYVLKKYIQKAKKIAQNNQMTLKDLAFQYCTQKNYIDRILIGVDNENQLIENLTSLSNKKEIDLSAIDSIHVKEKELLNPSNW